jgi:hypothetical protein
VGLRDGQLLANHHHCLDDSEIVSQAERHLTLINNILGSDERRYAAGGGIHALSNNAARGTVRETTHARMVGSKLRKLTWALGGKGDRSIQCALLKELVQQLHNLIPPEKGSFGAATSNEDTLVPRGLDLRDAVHGPGTKWDSWLAECHQMLSKMQGKDVTFIIHFKLTQSWQPKPAGRCTAGYLVYTLPMSGTMIRATRDCLALASGF